MATTPKTVRTYPLNGSTKDFTIPFEYLARKFVVVTLIGATRTELVITTDYRFTTSTQVTTNKAWGAGDGYEFIEIRRLTSATERLVDFADGSILRAYDLNISQVQSLHIAEEARDLTADTIGVNNDGNLDARARRIVNLADAVDPGDAVTLRQEQTWAASTLNNKNSSEASASASATSASAAASSASAAASSATASDASCAMALKWAENSVDVAVTAGAYSAKHHATKADSSASQAASQAATAETQATNAAGSASAAATSATTATTEANRSKTEADKAAVSASNLGNAVNLYSKVLNATTYDVSWVLATTFRFNGMKIGHAGLVHDTNLNLTASNGDLNGGATANTRFTAPIHNFVNASGEPLLHFRNNTLGGPTTARGSLLGDSNRMVLRAYDSVTGGFSSFYFNSSGALTVGGSVSAKGKFTMIGASSQWITLVAAGATPPASMRHTHNLGIKPIGYHFEMRCDVAELGYSVGDIIVPVNSTYNSSPTQAESRGGYLVYVDDNNVDYYAGGTGFVILNKSTGQASTLTLSRWSARVHAVALSG